MPVITYADDRAEVIVEASPEEGLQNVKLAQRLVDAGEAAKQNSRACFAAISLLLVLRYVRDAQAGVLPQS